MFMMGPANVVTKRFYAEGQINYQPSTINLFYTRDHLGSVREVTANTGTVRARYDYDPYGKITKVSGDLDSDFRYTGHYYHAQSGLHLALYRAYDSESGRWLNRDPIGEAGGINLYGYVGNNPVNLTDPTGLFFKEWGQKLGGWLYDKMMGDREGSYDKDGNMAQRAAMLGNDGADTLDRAMQEGVGMAVDNGTDSLAGAGVGKLFGVVCKVGKKAAKGTRGANKLKPDPDAQGAHTTLRRDPQTGQVTHYETWQPQPNPRNPNPWVSEKRFDRTGASHHNKSTGQDVPTPHVHDPTTPGGVRLPNPGEISR